MQEPQDIFYNKRALSLLRTLFTIPRPYVLYPDDFKRKKQNPIKEFDILRSHLLQMENLESADP